MRQPETFSLKWNNFHPCLANGFHDLLQEEMMVDVTLAVEGKYLQAHKIVLSVCSSYFKDLFKINPCRHPIVILKDIGYQAMSDMLHFMYKGEAVVQDTDVQAFLQLAETLKVRGLANNEETDEESGKTNGKEGDDDSETEVENYDEKEENNNESDPPSPSSLKKSTNPQIPENAETNGTASEDSNSNSGSRTEEPKRKKRKLNSSLEDSQMAMSSTSSSQPSTSGVVKREMPDTDQLRLMYDNDGETDIHFTSSQPATQEPNELEDSKLENNLDNSGNSSAEPDFDIKEFLNPDETDEVLETLYSATDLKGKVICYKGYKYRFFMLYEEGSKIWKCTARYKKCQAELEVHPAVGVFINKGHNHPQPKR